MLTISFSLFLVSALSAASVSRQIETLRARLHAVAGTRDTFGEKSPFDPLILTGRFQAWLGSNCTDSQTEECMEYFVSLRTPERVAELISEIILPVENQLSREEMEESFERLSAEISEVELQIDQKRSEHEKLKLNKHIQKYLSKMLKTMGECQSPPNSPNIQFVTTHEFREIKSNFDRYSSDLKNAHSIRDVDTAYEGFRQYMRRITTTDGIHPQIAWNACKYFYLQNAYTNLDTVSESEIQAIETTIRDLQRKRGELVLQKSIKKRTLDERD